MNRKSLIRIGIILIGFLILVALGVISSKYMLETTYYEIKMLNNRDDSIRIIHLSDLHDSVFGYENELLISKVTKEKPDLIFITGDLVNSHKRPDYSKSEKLISKLVSIAPVYVSLGNQEVSLINEGYEDIISNYANAGATVLDFSYVDTEIKGNRYRIGGIYGYCQPVAYAIETHRENESEFLMDFQDTDSVKLLLCHMPASWLNSYSLYDWNIDVIFSGHVHGGQVRIPFLGGLWAPDFGWFPGKLSGVYSTNPEKWKESRKKLLEFSKNMDYDDSYYQQYDDYKSSYLVLSRGLGNTDWLPRFNNVPEIVVVDLAIEEE